MFLQNKFFKNESKDCCEIRIEEVEEATLSEEQPSACCNTKGEELK